MQASPSNRQNLFQSGFQPHSQDPIQNNIQKFGFWIMAPIALTIHSLAFLIPLNLDQKTQEPEKKETLQPIDVSLAPLPAFTQPPTPTAKPSQQAQPKPQSIRTVQPAPQPVLQQPIQQPTQQPIQQPAQQPEIQQLKQQIQDLQNQVKPQTPPQTPEQPQPPIAPQQNPPEQPNALNTSGDILLHELGAKPCSGSLKDCYTTHLAQRDVLANLEKKFGTNAETIKDENENLLGYEIKNKEGQPEYLYFSFAQRSDPSGNAVTITTLQKLSERITDRNELQSRGINIM